MSVRSVRQVRYRPQVRQRLMRIEHVQGLENASYAPCIIGNWHELRFLPMARR